MKRLFAIAAVAFSFCVFQPSPAEAEVLEAVLLVPRAVVNDGLNTMVGPVVDLSQTIPSANDVRAVPVPRRRALIEYPVEVLRYGLNLYPGSRTARQNGLIRF